MTVRIPSPRTQAPGKVAFKVQRVIAARMQVIEQLLDLADLVDDHAPMDALLQRQVVQRDIDTLRAFITAYLGVMTEWQASSLHEQFNALRDRAAATTTKEN